MCEDGVQRPVGNPQKEDEDAEHNQLGLLVKAADSHGKRRDQQRGDAKGQPLDLQGLHHDDSRVVPR